MNKSLAVIFLLAACTPAASSVPTWEAARVVVAVGGSVLVVVDWVPGSTDSLTFIISHDGEDEGGRKFLTPPFSPPDTLVLGPRPAPGVSDSWVVSVDAWYTDRGVPTRLQQTLGTVTYTEPQTVGVPPSFGPLPAPDTTAGGSANLGVGPVGLLLVFSQEQVQAMDTLPSCVAAQVTACVGDLLAGGFLNDASYPTLACGVVSSLQGNFAVFHAVGGAGSDGRTHECSHELAAQGYPRAAVALNALKDTVRAGAFLSTLGPVTRWLAGRL